MLNLGNLSPKKGSTKDRKRLGRGPGTGHGKTAGRGHKGYKSRSGSGTKPGFEGGQMPLQRRLPKRGFNNIFMKEYSIISLSQLDKLDVAGEIDRQVLTAAGMCKKNTLVKILANGEIKKAVTVKVDKISKNARAAIEEAGGSVVLVSEVAE